MEVSDIAVGPGSFESRSTLARIGRTSILSLALVLAGSTGYAAFAWEDGEVRHSISEENPRARVTYVGFDSWQGIIPSPSCAEYCYQELRLPSGEWVKHGRYGRITRRGTAREEGWYDHGQRDGRWTFYDSHGGYDVESSGFYSKGVRVGPGPASQTDQAWAAALRAE